MKKESLPESIMHDGVVQAVGNNKIVVRITAAPDCAGCHASGVCGFAGREEKIIDISGNYDVKPGENVTVMMQKSMGFKAVLLSYMIPFILVMAALIVLVSLSVSELTAGLVSISVLVPYFLILYFFRKRIDRNFIFTLKT